MIPSYFDKIFSFGCCVCLQLSRLLGDVQDLVCSEIVAPDVQTARDALTKLQSKCEQLSKF